MKSEQPIKTPGIADRLYGISGIDMRKYSSADYYLGVEIPDEIKQDLQILDEVYVEFCVKKQDEERRANGRP